MHEEGELQRRIMQRAQQSSREEPDGEGAPTRDGGGGGGGGGGGKGGRGRGAYVVEDLVVIRSAAVEPAVEHAGGARPPAGVGVDTGARVSSYYATGRG